MAGKIPTCGHARKSTSKLLEDTLSRLPLRIWFNCLIAVVISGLIWRDLKNHWYMLQPCSKAPTKLSHSCRLYDVYDVVESIQTKGGSEISSISASEPWEARYQSSGRQGIWTLTLGDEFTYTPLRSSPSMITFDGGFKFGPAESCSCFSFNRFFLNRTQEGFNALWEGKSTECLWDVPEQSGWRPESTQLKENKECKDDPLELIAESRADLSRKEKGDSGQLLITGTSQIFL